MDHSPELWLVGVLLASCLGQAGSAMFQPLESPRHECEPYEPLGLAEDSQPGGQVQTLALDTGETPAGEYFLKASTASFAGDMAVSEGDEPHPPHFGTPYVFRVETGSGGE